MMNYNTTAVRLMGTQGYGYVFWRYHPFIKLKSNLDLSRVFLSLWIDTAEIRRKRRTDSN